MPSQNFLRICFFASHGGSNMQAIIDNINSGKLDAEAVLMISNNSKSLALKRAKDENIPAYHISSATNPENLDDIILERIKEHKANIIVLAGYMKKLSSKIIDSVNGNVLNIHPALLPKFGGKGMYGMNVHKAVIGAKETESGATVHIVNTKFDDGKILNQMKVEVKKDDTPEILAEKVLKIEHILFTDTLIKICNWEIELKEKI